MAESSSIIDLLKANRGVRILYLVQIVGLIVIILNPLGLPLVVDEYTRGLYNDLKNLPDDSVVVIQAHSSLAFIPETYPGAVAALNLLFSKNVKIIIFNTNQEGIIYMPQILNDVKESIINQKEYGVDWLMFGFAPGGELAIAAFASDIRGVYTVDIYGTPIEELPLMKDINNHEDIDVVIGISGSLPMDEASVRQWVASYDTPYYTIAFAGGFTNMQPYYPNQVKGMTNGVLGSAQLELLVGIPGKGAQISDALTYVFGLGLASVIIGNILYHQERRRSK